MNTEIIIMSEAGSSESEITILAAEIRIVGMKYRPQYVRAELENSEEYKLAFEENNTYDINAIAAYYRHKCRDKCRDECRDKCRDKCRDECRDDWVHFGYVVKEQNKNARLRSVILKGEYKMYIKKVYDAVIYANMLFQD